MPGDKELGDRTPADSEAQAPKQGPIRVTTGGHVAKYAARALELLEVSFTLPLRELTAQSGQTVTLTTRLATQPKARSALHPATLAIPRLVSVAEKVKREWLATHDDVWQYNVSGAATALERPSLERVLAGKTR